MTAVPALSTQTYYLFSSKENWYRMTLYDDEGENYYAAAHYLWLTVPTDGASYNLQASNYDPYKNKHIWETVTYSDSGKWQVNGSPHYWYAHTSNTESAVVIASNSSWGAGDGWTTGKYMFVRSQWQEMENVDVSYELLDSGGSPVQSGTLDGSYSKTINTPQGACTLNTSYPGLLRGNSTVGTMTTTFDTSLSDKNPPVIQELQIRQDGERTDTVADGEGQVAVRAADVDTFTVEIAVDRGNGWQNLPVSTSGDFQVANLPAFYPSEDKEVSLRITTTDASGNQMVNTIAPAFIVQEAIPPAGWTLAVNSSGTSGVAITGNPSDYGGTTNYSKTDIADGSIITLTAPAAGSASTTFSSWSGCDATDASARTCTVTMSADKTVTTSFVINIYTVTPIAGEHGSISPDSAQRVNHGNTTSFTLTPDIGYGINTVEGCGGTLSGNTYTTGAISADCAVTATFVSNTIYTVIPKARRHGSIAPDTPQQVSEGKSTSFTVTPDDGYTIKSVSGCEGTLDDNIYTTGPITGKCRVRASFKKNPVVISSAGRHGSIEPSGRLSVSEGTVLHFTVTPDAGYFVKSVSGCGGKLNGNVYTADSISRKCKVKASFKRKR
ncbi:hypothetical protein GMJAKD_06985 [Candidatus Electrothrix aarhusensis]